jgi:hypothetical protein
LKDFEIKFVLNNGRNKFSFSCPCGLQYFSTWRNIVTHGQLKENRYIPSLERDNLVEFHYLSAFEIRSDEKRASGGYGLVRECY